VFSASATLRIDREGPASSSSSRSCGKTPRGFGPDAAADYLNLLQSRALAARVVDRLELADQPEFGARSAAGELLDAFRRSPAGRSGSQLALVKVSFQSRNRAIGARANGVTETFIAQQLDHRVRRLATPRTSSRPT